MTCPECGQPVLGIWHEWSGTADTATFEYHHQSHAEPCVVVLPYHVGMVRYQQEWAEMHGEGWDVRVAHDADQS